jgi:hypothetical protein
LSGASTSAFGCSTKIFQPSGSTFACAVSTSTPAASW